MADTYLITGGTGSFGHAFVRHLLSDSTTGRVVVLSRDELKQAQMRVEFPDKRMRFFIGSVTDPERVGLAMRGIDYVIHAAAMKRVETCEENPHEAFTVNTYGTQVVARAALLAGVKRALFLSTDKAVEPNTMYGTTKLSAERLWTASNVYAAGTDTRYAATRYGNVLGSRGSVVGFWRGQADRGESLSVTDPDMTRFWMTIDNAVALIAMALREMRGGEVFIPKVGASNLMTLARATTQDADSFVGLGWQRVGTRPGEKMHEALIGVEEARSAYEYDEHYRIEPHARTWEDNVQELGAPVPEGFSYRSDTTPHQLTVEQLREMLP